MGSLDYITGRKQYQPKKRETIEWSKVNHCQMCNAPIEDRCWSRSIYCKQCRRLSVSELRERCRELYEGLRRCRNLQGSDGEELRRLRKEKEGKEA